MRDRIKGRKKSSATTKSEPTQAPLQPAYFDTEASSAPTKAEKEPAPSPKDVESEIEQPAEKASEAPSGAQPKAPKRRRRRGRGGRGGAKAPVAAVTERSGSSDNSAPVPAAHPQAVAQPAHLQPANAAPARAPKGIVVLAIGLPGSGKSSWFKRHNITPLSSDLLRSILFDDPAEQRFQDLVFSNLRSMLKARLIARRPMNYVDATNLTSHDRHSWIKLAKDFGYEVHAVFFDVPLEVCLERNKKRPRTVGEDVLRRLASKLKPPTFEEGFAKITVVRVKAKPDSGSVAEEVG
ncbi:MAG TPA: AAA family ATPase [Terriglobales bacterium]